VCRPLRVATFIFKCSIVWLCISCFSIHGHAQTFGDSVEIDQRNLDASRGSAELAEFEEQRANVAIINFAGDYNRSNASNEFNLEARAAVARSFYTRFADDFDFLVVFTTFEFDTGNALAFFHPVRNNIEGIGRNIFDNGLLYDSQSGLQGYIDMAAFTRYELDPTAPAYRFVLNTLSHEIMHRWFSGIEYVDDSGATSTDLLGLDGDHWPVYSDTQASVMGGALWRDNGDNTHTALDSFRQYSDFDLYLAGLLPPAPEFSIDLIRDDGDPERLFPSLDETVSGERESITLDQIIAANGPRIPGYDEAQRSFQLGFIILKRPGETVPDSLIQAITRVQDDFPQRFSAQTGGVGIALSHLPQSGSGVAGVPAPVIDQAGQTMALDVDSAVDWLLVQQSEAGFWQDKPATRVRDTALAARFISHARPASSAWASGRDWLLSHTAASSDDQVWQLVSSLLPGEVNSQLIADLIGQQIPDGGWGLQRRFQSSPLDTARVAASVGGGLPNMLSEQTYSYLRSLQNANGSWSPVNGGVSQLMTTAHAINALKLQSSNAQAVDTAVQWLQSQQREDGGYGSESSTVSTTVAVLRALSGSLPGSDPGIQNAIAFLSNRQHIDGHWEFSVHSTAQAADFLSSQGRPNLLWQSFATQPSPAVSGQPVQVTAVVRNNGVVGSAASTAILVDATSGSDELVAGPLQVDAMAAGDSLELNFFLDTSGLSGERQLLLRLDPDLLIDEINELDNESAVPLYIESTLSGIDAAIFSAELELDPATIGSLPVSVQLSVRVRNLGDQTANGLTLALIDNRSNGQVELQRTTLDLPPAGQEQVTLTLDIQTRPVNTFSIVLDPDNVLSEVNENNNQIDFSIPSTDGVDLAVGMADIIINPQPAIVGSDNALQVIFRNVGTTDAPPASAMVLEHFDGQTRTLLDTITQLPAGGSDARMISWRPLQTGEHQIEVLLDQDNVIAETDESNNTNSASVNVDAASLGNLMIDSWQATPDPALEGQSDHLQALIRNGGAAINSGIGYSIYSGDPQQGGVLLASNEIPAGLDSGTTTSIEFTTEILSGPGNRIFILQLDPAGQIMESDESDNDSFIEVTVRSLPDLLVTTAAVNLTPTSPVPGQTVTANINVNNLGQQASGAFEISIEQAESSGSFSPAAPPVSVNDIPGEAGAVAQIAWIWPTDQSIDRLRVTVDSSEAVIESNESNNVVIRSVTSQSGDLFLSELFISPDGNGVKDTSEIAFSLASADTLTVQIVDPTGRVIRMLGPFEQVAQGSVIWDGRDASGRVVDDEDYRVRLVGSNGIRAISTITVDTNRYPLYRAIGTPREHVSLLSCEIRGDSNSKMAFSIDGEQLLISNPEEVSSGADLDGIYRIPTIGRGLQTVVSRQWLEELAIQEGFDQRLVSEFYVLSSGEILFLTSDTGCASQCEQKIWITGGSGGTPRMLNFSSLQFTSIVDVIDESMALVQTRSFSPAFDRLYYLVDLNGINPAQTVNVPAQASVPSTALAYIGRTNDGFLLTDGQTNDPDASDNARIWYAPFDPAQFATPLEFTPGEQPEYFALSENGRHFSVLVSVDGAGSQAARLLVYDMESGVTQPSSIDVTGHGSAADLTVQWSPGTNRLYVVNRQTREVRQYDSNGNSLRVYDLPDVTVFDEIISRFNGIYVTDDGVTIPQPGQGCPGSSGYKIAMNEDLRPPIYTGSSQLIVHDPLLFSPDGSSAVLSIEATDDAPIEGCLEVSLSSAMYKISASSQEMVYLPDLKKDFYSPCQSFDLSCLSGVDLQSNNINRSAWLLPSDGIIADYTVGSFDGVENLLAQLTPEVYATSTGQNRVVDLYPRISGLDVAQLLYRNSIVPGIGECENLPGNQDYSSRSLDNTIAHLEAESENGLFVLSGVASDRHLDHYLLEWAAVDTPNQRNVLLPPQPHEVVDDIMTFWSPPQAGVFNVHLTVIDQAGNRSSDVVSVSSSESASISSISGSPAFISPNGDGVSDQYQIQFRVFQPLMVNVLIADSSGMTVRNITENIVSPTGELMTVMWDGRDDDGILVADGAYTVTVNDRPLFVTVDTQPPQLINEPIDYGYDGIVRANGPGSLSAKLSARILDANSGQFKFELQLPASNDWITVDDGGFPCIFQSSPIPCASESFPVEIVSGSQARIIATDVAGNQALVNIPPAEPELFLLGSANIDSVDGDDFDLLQTAYLTDDSQGFFDAPNADNTGMYAVSNLPLPADSITMEFSNDGDAWFELPISQLDQDAAESGLWGFQHPSGNDPFWNNHHVLLWESANYPQFQSYSIRLRAITSQGEELMSNEVNLGNVLSSGVVGQQAPDPVWAKTLLNQATAALPPVPQNTIRLWLSGFSELQPAENIQLSVTSNSDPRYLVPVNIAPVTIQRTIDNERHRFVAVFEVSIECLLDYAADFSSRLRLLAGDVVTLHEQRNFVDSCGFSVNVGPDFATACGSSALNQVIVDTLFEPSESARLDAIIIRRALPNGVGEVLISDTSPGPAFNSYVLDTSMLSLGQHALLVTAVLDNGDELTGSASFLVQDEVPNFAIVSPQVGERICLDSDIIDLSAEQLALPVEGFIAGTQPYTYRISLQSAGSTAVFGLLDDDGGPGRNGAAESGIKLNSSVDCDPVSVPDCRLQVTSSGSDQGSLGVLRRDLDNLLANGQFHAIMSATNWSGALACVDHPFELDADVNAGAPVISRNVISPNADGDFDDTVISLFTAEPVLISAQLFNAQRASNGSFVPIGSALENLFDALPASGDFQYVWNGIGPQGAYADGIYIVQLNLMDDCGFTRNDNVVIAVDNTGPEVLINFPQTDSELSTVIEVLGTVSDLHLDRYRLAFRETGASGSGATLATGEHEVVNDFLGFWNLSGLLGPYELLLTAVDEVNNSSETSVTIDINELGSLIFAFDAQPRKFSPDGNGVLDGAVATLGLLANADIDISVVDGLGSSIRQLLDSNLQSGSHQVVWNGLNNNGSVVADGQYDITVLASNGGQFQDEMISVVVDNTPPLIQLIHPQGEFSDGAGALSVQFDDANFSGYQIYRSPQSGAPASQLVVQGDMAGMVDALNLSVLGEGVYSVRALAFDQAGNESLLERTFSIDRTPPEVDLLTPIDGSFLSIQAGPVPIQGQFSDLNFSAYSIDIRSAGTTDTWQNLVSGNELPSTSLLFEWDLGVPDGAYELRLQVTDLAGNVRTDTVTITIDNSAPVVALTAPEDGAVIGPVTQILGQASDLNLRRYRVSLSPAISNPPLWSDFIAGDQSVLDGILGAFTALPADGDYQLRLLAEDRASNTAAIIQAVTVDGTAPATPQNLNAQVAQGGAVELNWNPVSDADLAGYRLFRDAAVIDVGVTNASSFTDTGAADGEHVYHVAAVDILGNQSPLSNPAVVQIDTTPPIAILLAPEAGSRHAGNVAVRASAYGDDDLANYRLYLAADGETLPGDLLTQSGVPVNASLIFSLDTTVLMSESSYKLTLVAEDLTANQAQVTVQIVVDNTAPAAPIGLQASLDQDTATLTWAANAESDLLGYLLLRNGKFVNGPAMSDDLRPLALAESHFADAGLPDGEHSYTVLAIDAAGNVSAPSAAVTVVVEQGPPDLQLLQPVDGRQFDGPLLMVAQSADLDIAEVVFEYRPTTGGPWVMIGNADTLAPFEATLDPTGLNPTGLNPADLNPTELERGFYQLRGLALDQGGLADPSPPVVSVEYRDLNPPPPVTLVTAQVTGSDVVLNWDGVSADDLAGYHIDRTVDASTTRITGSAVVETNFTDAGLTDGVYSYQVMAVDDNDNESTPSAAIDVQIVTPRLDATAPLTADSSVVLTGFVGVQGNAVLTVTPSGYTDTQPVMNDGAFSFDNVPLNVDDNLLSVVIDYAGGNVSNAVSLMITQAQSPSAPTGLMADVIDQQVSLNWNPNPEPDIAGYQVYLNNSPLIQSPSINGLVAEASVENASADNSVDNNFNTFWQIPGDSLLNGSSQSIRYSLPQPEIVSGMTLQWQRSVFDARFPPQRFQVQAMFNGAWQTLAEQDNDGQARHTLRFDQPIRTDQVRVLLFGPPQTADVVRLYEASLRRLGLIVSTTHDVGPLPNGAYEFFVTAINDIGLESDNSDPAAVVIGDFIAPGPVTLEALVIGSDVQLSWNVSQATDLGHYQLYRDGEPLATVMPPETLFLDTNLAGGDYTYSMTVVDLAGNESAPSNAVTVTVQADAPEPPVNLIVVAPPSGNLLELSWAMSPSPDVVRYHVSRSLQSGGPYAVLASVDAPQSSYQDTTVIPGQTYHYVLQASDAPGNLSAFSNEASATPIDSVTPPPPVITFPTSADEPIQVESPSLAVAGSAEPGVRVDLRNNNQLVASTQALADYSVIEAPLATFVETDDVLLSPDGRWLFVSDFPVDRLMNIENGQEIALTTRSGFGQWSEDALTFFVRSDDRSEVLAYDISTQQLTTLYSAVEINAFAVSPDRTQLFVAGIHDAGAGMVEGVWLTDLITGAVTMVADTGRYFVNRNTVRWSPEGEYVGFTYNELGNELYVVNALGELQTTVPLGSGSGSIPEWRPGGDGLLVVARNAMSRRQVLFLAEPFASVMPETLTVESGVDHTMPSWSPDGNALLWIRGGFQTFDVFDFTQRSVMASIFMEEFEFVALRWLNNGTIRALDYDSRLDVEQPGRFVIEQTLLNVGSNEFIATAVDGAGNQSFGSAPVMVSYLPQNQADLVLDTLSVLPATASPNQNVSVNLGMANQGSVDADALFGVRLVDGFNNTIIQLPTASLGQVPAGDAISGSVTLSAPGAAGAYRVIVTADPGNQIAELDESNNTDVADFAVVDDGPPTLMLNLGQSTVLAGGLLTGVASVFNPGNTVDLRLLLSIEDNDNVLVGNLPAIEIDDLFFAESRVLPFTWDSMQTFAGDYHLRAQLVDSSGSLITEQIVPFTLIDDAQITVQVGTDQVQYETGGTVLIASDIDYVQGNSPIDGGQLRLHAFSVDGVEVYSEVIMLGRLLPGDQTEIVASWSLQGLAVGEYNIVAGVFIEGTEAANDNAVIAVNPASSNQALAGTVTLATPSVAHGSPIQTSFEIINIGDTSVQGELILELVATGQSGVLDQHTRAINLESSAVLSGDHDVATDALTPGAYSVLLRAQLGTDNSLLDVVNLNVVDAGAPVIGIVSPAQDAVLGAEVLFRVNANDSLSAIDNVRISVDGGAPRNMALGANGEYNSSFVLADGNHLFAITATDTAGNSASVEGDFVVDTVPPAITITGVSDGLLTNQPPVTPVIAIVDDHLQSSSIVLNNQSYLSATPITADGDYVLLVSAVDEAGNSNSATRSFTIDTVGPEVALISPESGSVVTTSSVDIEVLSEADVSVSLQNEFGDTFVESTDATGRAIFMAVPLNAGDNNISMQATDMATNVGAVNNFVVTLDADPVAAVSGGLQIPESDPFIPRPIRVNYSVVNTGNVPFSDLPIRLQLINSLNQNVAAMHAIQEPLEVNETISESLLFTTEGLEPGDYLMVLQADIEAGVPTELGSIPFSLDIDESVIFMDGFEDIVPLTPSPLETNTNVVFADNADENIMPLSVDALSHVDDEYSGKNHLLHDAVMRSRHEEKYPPVLEQFHGVGQ